QLEREHVCRIRSDSTSASPTLRRCAAFFCLRTSPTELFPLSLHDALPISAGLAALGQQGGGEQQQLVFLAGGEFHGGRMMASHLDRKSTRLNSSHVKISYAVFCLKQKKPRRNMGRRIDTARCHDQRSIKSW